MLLHLGWFALAVLLLALGGDSLAKGLGALAMRLGARAASTGIVLVAFAGSLPDLAVNLVAVLTGHAALALGNIVGSALVNLGLVLGLAALSRPLSIRLPAARVLVPAMIATPLLLLGASHNGRLGYLDGGVLMALFVVLAVMVARHRATHADEPVAQTFAAYTQTRPSPALNVLRVVLGAGLLGYGAWMLVPHAVALAGIAQVSEVFFGLTAVALATSLPQLVFALLAAKRRHGEVAFASVAGSNLCNLLLILGVTALLHPLPLPASMAWLELPALLAFAVALYPMLRGDGDIERSEGAVLLGGWLALTAFQVWLVMR